MTQDDAPARARWARLRFSIVGPLLAAPPDSGELKTSLAELAARTWRHPTSGEPVQFGISTLERWYYQARNAPDDPVGALERRVRKGAGEHTAISVALKRAIELQYREHPRWSYQLHYDNLAALAELEPELEPLPSYTTVRRYMRGQGLVKLRKKRRNRGEHDDPTAPYAPREMRSFEVSEAQRLWHSDFHVGSRKVLLPTAEWKTPVLFGALDDYSRLACHLQWYLVESSETFVHGFSQALQKRPLPRALLTDNGKAFTAAEVEEGLTRLGIVHWTTLPYTPEQNAKQEAFWAQIEGRLMPMLENEAELTLDLLNRATLAWVELEYNQKPHSETGVTPYERFTSGPDAGRPSRTSEELRHVFRMEQRRTQRHSDGTVSVCGKRFELPSRYRTLQRPTVRFARWDLSSVDLVDARTGLVLCTLLPVDKQRNADGVRRTVESLAETVAEGEQAPAPAGRRIAPLLEKYLADYAATGMPPAYLPHPPPTDSEEHDE